MWEDTTKDDTMSARIIHKEIETMERQKPGIKAVIDLIENWEVFEA
jgi:hypothetical protein